MSQETLLKIYETIKNYSKQKKEHPEYIDFYEMYGINPEKTADELKSDIRNVRKLFHPDQKQYIGEEYFIIYDEIIKQNSKLFVLENNPENKKKYDDYLEYFKKKHGQEKMNDYKKYENSKWTNDSNIYNDRKKYDEYKKNNAYSKDEKYVKNIQTIETVIETMMYKYGFGRAFGSLSESLKGNYDGVTRENNCRDKLRNIGRGSILETLKYINPEQKEIDTVMDLFLDVMNRSAVNGRAEDFYSMCNQTQYQSKNGSMYLSDIINSKMKYNDYRSNSLIDRRYNQGGIKAFTPGDIRFLMYARLHKDGQKNPQNLFSNFRELEKNYENPDEFLSSSYCELLSKEKQNKSGFGY